MGLTAWTTLFTVAAVAHSMEDGKKQVKQQEEKKWKWAASPGDGKRFAVFQCNAHLNCTRFIRVAKHDDCFYLEEKGKHTTEVNTRKRKNSTLTFDEEATLKLLVDGGCKPGGACVSMLNQKATELKEIGEKPLDHKKDDGGLIGMYPTCILCVS